MDKNKNTLFLPAFGDLTGGYPCKKSFKKWAIVSEEEIIEIKSWKKSYWIDLNFHLDIPIYTLKSRLFYLSIILNLSIYFY